MTATAKPAWAPLAADLAEIMRPVIPDARAALWAAAVELTRDEVTGRASPQVIDGALVIWAAAEVMRLEPSPDLEQLATISRCLVTYLSERSRRPAVEVKRRLWAYVLDLRAARARPDRDPPKLCASDLATAYLRLRRDLSDATRANADLAAAEERAAAGHTYSANGTCRSCGQPIHWRLTEAGRRSPHNLDGSSHFASCPQADHWRKSR